MSDRKHTPGPWVAGVLSDSGSWGVCTEDFTALCTMTAAPGPHNKANAYMMAAAPDMFAACIEAFDFLRRVDRSVPLRRKLLDAIAKAEGR